VTNFIPKSENQTYEVDREAFIRWVFSNHKSKIDSLIKSMQQDLIGGSEFILTAEEVLTVFTAIPATMVLNYNGPDLTVLAEKCHLVLKSSM